MKSDKQGTPSTQISSLFYTPDRFGNSDNKVLFYKGDNFQFEDEDEQDFSFGENHN